MNNHTGRLTDAFHRLHIDAPQLTRDDRNLWLYDRHRIGQGMSGL